MIFLSSEEGYDAIISANPSLLSSPIPHDVSFVFFDELVMKHLDISFLEAGLPDRSRKISGRPQIFDPLFSKLVGKVQVLIILTRIVVMMCSCSGELEFCPKVAMSLILDVWCVI